MVALVVALVVDLVVALEPVQYLSLSLPWDHKRFAYRRLYQNLGLLDHPEAGREINARLRGRIFAYLLAFEAHLGFVALATHLFGFVQHFVAAATAYPRGLVHTKVVFVAQHQLAALVAEVVVDLVVAID